MKQSETILGQWIRGAYAWVKDKGDWVAARPGRGLEWSALLLYVGLVAILMVFHEPWYDEAQAWQIAKYASLQDILFIRPHYEGHPPLWHLVLLPFAKLGVSFEWGIKIPNLMINTLAVGLLLWKSPFYRPVKLALPFTFFLFYQYGVISRNYCLFFLAIVLCAMTYLEKNQKPFRFCAALMLLCLSSLYGIAFAAGICLVWLWDLGKGKKFRQFFKAFWGSRIMAALTVLFVLNLGLVSTLIPRPDTFAVVASIEPRSAVNTLLRLIYTVFIAPMDALFYDSGILTMTPSELITPINVLIGCLFMGMVCYVGKAYGVLRLYCIPYGIFSLVSMSYLYSHHIGVITLFFIFVAWCAKAQNPKSIPLFTKMKKEEERLLLCRGGTLIGALLLAIPISWSISSAINEVKYNYGHERDAVEYIRQHNLDSERYNFMVGWRHKTIEQEDGTERLFESFQHLEGGITEMAYLEKNIFYNFNDGDESKPYLLHEIDAGDEARQRLAAFGPPDIILGVPALYSLWPDGSVEMPQYVAVAAFEGNTIYKRTMQSNATLLFVKEDLLGEIGAEPLSAESNS